MRVIYEAYDGRQFDDEFECEDYEFSLNHPHLFGIVLYDEDGKEYCFNRFYVSNEDNYFSCEKVIIHDDQELVDFHCLSTNCGWCEFSEQIDSPGTWVRYKDKITNGIWKKIGD